MNWANLARKMAAAGFPALGGALAGPAGAIVAATIAERLGVELAPDSIAKAVAYDPNLKIVLRRLEAEQEATETTHAALASIRASLLRIERTLEERAIADMMEENWMPDNPPVTPVAVQMTNEPTNKLARGTTAAGAIGGVIAGVLAAYGAPAFKEMMAGSAMGPETQDLVVLLLVTLATWVAAKYGGQQAAWNVLDKPNVPIDEVPRGTPVR